MCINFLALVRLLSIKIAPIIDSKKGCSYHKWFIEFDKLPKDLKSLEKNIDFYLQEQNIYFDCGNSDELQLFPHSEDMHDKLFELGIPHTYAPYSGSHSGSIYQKLEDSFEFHSDYFSSIDFDQLGDLNGDGLLNILDIVQTYQSNKNDICSMINYELSNNTFDQYNKMLHNCFYFNDGKSSKRAADFIQSLKI